MQGPGCREQGTRMTNFRASSLLHILRVLYSIRVEVTAKNAFSHKKLPFTQSNIVCSDRVLLWTEVMALVRKSTPLCADLRHYSASCLPCRHYSSASLLVTQHVNTSLPSLNIHPPITTPISPFSNSNTAQTPRSRLQLSYASRISAHHYSSSTIDVLSKMRSLTGNSWDPDTQIPDLSGKV